MRNNMNQKNQIMQSIRNGLEMRRKKLRELENGILNNETRNKISHLKKEIRILETELEELL